MLQSFEIIGLLARDRHDNIAVQRDPKPTRLAAALSPNISPPSEFDASKLSLSPAIRIVHETSVGGGTLALDSESSGTQTWLAMIGGVLSTLDSGGVLVVDELDARLHPALAGSLLAIFQSKQSNKRGAQIVFNSHDLSLLGPHVTERLRRHQVWFAAKDSGSTKLYPLTEYRVREGLDNVERAYFRGRYGAVPFIDQMLVDDIVK